MSNKPTDYTVVAVFENNSREFIHTLIWRKLNEVKWNVYTATCTLRCVYSNEMWQCLRHNRVHVPSSTRAKWIHKRSDTVISHNTQSRPQTFIPLKSMAFSFLSSSPFSYKYSYLVRLLAANIFIPKHNGSAQKEDEELSISVPFWYKLKWRRVEEIGFDCTKLNWHQIRTPFRNCFVFSSIHDTHTYTRRRRT